MDGKDGGWEGHILDGCVGMCVKQRKFPGAEGWLLTGPNICKETRTKQHLGHAAMPPEGRRWTNHDPRPEVLAHNHSLL